MLVESFQVSPRESSIFPISEFLRSPLIVPSATPNRSPISACVHPRCDKRHARGRKENRSSNLVTQGYEVELLARARERLPLIKRYIVTLETELLARARERLLFGERF